jgi:tRNA modification GTPase
MYREDTIAAIATPPGEGGVAIVRISGVDAEVIAGQIFVHAQQNTARLNSHKLYHGRIRDPQNQRVLDEVLLTIMRAPRSYTGENVVEIHCHGGALVVKQVLGLVLRQGARQAEPGEFTKRAFLNGRMDLTQAEAVLDLIRARTDKSAGLALEQAGGALSQWVVVLREELLDILVQVEAAIDFPEEEIELLRRHELAEKIRILVVNIKAISATYDWGKLFREGARVCICGRPNVGKSSLLNALLGEDRVIVTPIAGTTRDVIEESLNLDGLPIVLADTAGMRDSDDEIERIGVSLSRQQLANADAALVVLDGSEDLSSEDRVLLGGLTEKKLLIAVNKSDLSRRLELSDPALCAQASHVQLVSARTGNGIFELKQSLRELLLNAEMETPVTITNERHRSALERSVSALNQAATSLGENLAPEFVAVDLNEARKALEEITGMIENDDILERIFSNFCIGK